MHVLGGKVGKRGVFGLRDSVFVDVLLVYTRELGERVSWCHLRRILRLTNQGQCHNIHVVADVNLSQNRGQLTACVSPVSLLRLSARDRSHPPHCAVHCAWLKGF